jgi:hypothetical protein
VLGLPEGQASVRWAPEPATGLFKVRVQGLRGTQKGEEHMSNEFYDLGKRMYERLKPAVPIATQRPWVGLTDADIKEIVRGWGNTPIKGYTRKFIDRLEAKLKEKNT